MNKKNPIRLTEAEARRYDGKIKGLSSGGGHSSSPRKRKTGKRFKRAGVFGGSGLLGLGQSRQRISARNRGEAMKKGTPAQKRAWAKCRKNPSKKQLAARRRFAAMSRANATARRDAARGVTRRSHKKPGKSHKSVKAPAKKAAAQSHNPKKKGTKKRGGKFKQLVLGKVLFGKSQKELDSKRRARLRRIDKLSSNPGVRKHNKAVEELFKTFVGRDSHSVSDADFPNGSPTNLARLGLLVKLVSETETFKFEESERVYLAADPRGNLYIGGRQQPVEPNTNFGHLLAISYVCRKAHIEPGQIVQYDHKFGDEGGKQPRLRSDKEGRFLISGGAYTITSGGIAD